MYFVEDIDDCYKAGPSNVMIKIKMFEENIKKEEEERKRCEALLAKTKKKNQIKEKPIEVDNTAVENQEKCEKDSKTKECEATDSKMTHSNSDDKKFIKKKVEEPNKLCYITNLEEKCKNGNQLEVEPRKVENTDKVHIQKDKLVSNSEDKKVLIKEKHNERELKRSENSYNLTNLKEKYKNVKQTNEREIKVENNNKCVAQKEQKNLRTNNISLSRKEQFDEIMRINNNFQMEKKSCNPTYMKKQVVKTTHPEKKSVLVKEAAVTNSQKISFNSRLEEGKSPIKKKYNKFFNNKKNFKKHEKQNIISNVKKPFKKESKPEKQTMKSKINKNIQSQKDMQKSEFEIKKNLQDKKLDRKRNEQEIKKLDDNRTLERERNHKNIIKGEVATEDEEVQVVFDLAAIYREILAEEEEERLKFAKDNEEEKGKFSVVYLLKEEYDENLNKKEKYRSERH